VLLQVAMSLRKLRAALPFVKLASTAGIGKLLKALGSCCAFDAARRLLKLIAKA